MKHALIVAALLMTGVLAHAGPVSSDYADPNNKYSELAKTKPASCWKQDAAGGDTSDSKSVTPNTDGKPADRFATKNAPRVA